MSKNCLQFNFSERNKNDVPNVGRHKKNIRRTTDFYYCHHNRTMVNSTPLFLRFIIVLIKNIDKTSPEYYKYSWDGVDISQCKYVHDLCRCGPEAETNVQK